MKATPYTKTVAALLKLKKSGMLIVNPEYQRGEVWKSLSRNAYLILFSEATQP